MEHLKQVITAKILFL